MPAHIVVVSPHLDDAVLDCGDHVRSWLAGGCEVLVITVFTSFAAPRVSPYQQEFMRRLGVDGVEKFERLRLEEDRQAMQRLGVEYRHLGFTDAGFRSRNGRLLYPSYRDLCDGRINDDDRRLVREIADQLSPFVSEAQAIVPLGVGLHRDHLIAKEAVESALPAERVSYCVDFPYARNPLKWRPGQLWALVASGRSFKLMSCEKRAALACYESQIRFMFRGRPIFPEIVLGPLARV